MEKRFNVYGPIEGEWHVYDAVPDASIDSASSADEAARKCRVYNGEHEDGGPVEFRKGDRVYVKGWRSARGKGLDYPSGMVTVAEDGIGGGWDVYDTTDGGSFYGFSVVGNVGQ